MILAQQAPSGRIILPTDPNWALCTMYLDFTPQDGVLTNFYDVANSGAGVSKYGSPTQSGVSSKWRGLSLQNSASGLSEIHRAGLDLTTGDWTVRCSFRTTSVATFQFLVVKVETTGFYPFAMYISGSKLVGFGYDTSNATAFNIAGTTTLSNSTDYNAQLTRSGNNIYLDLDGASEGSASFSGALRTNSADKVNIGCNGVGTSALVGTMHYLQVYKGVAKPRTEVPNFKPPRQ